VPASALAVSGKTFRLEPNPFGWDTLSFNFSSGGYAAVTVNGAEMLPIGLEGQYRITDRTGAGLRPVALRGSWQRDGTFLVENLDLGTISEYEVPMDLAATPAVFTVRERVFGGQPVQITGQLEE
jgi:hypothetical protein